MSHKGKTKNYILRIFSLAYYYFFIEAATYRESCYSCPYACEERSGDLTTGDFWKIEKSLPYFSKKKDVVHKGVSCLLVNSKYGKDLLSKAGEYIELINADFNFIKQENGQLRHPSDCRLDRNRIMTIYMMDGYSGLAKELRKELGIKFYYEQIKAMVPQNIKNICKKVLRRR